MLTANAKANPERRPINGFVGFASLPNQIHRDAVQSGFEFTLMVVGESGLGKTTLLNSLFLTDLYQNGQNKVVRSTMDIETSTVMLEEKGVRLRLNLVDTPGYGILVDNSTQIQQIVDYVDEQFSAYVEAEMKVNMTKIADTRVHACLYFIAPNFHGLKAIDIQFMKKLHDKVNLIPVIAKADAFTREELKAFKSQIRCDMEEHGIHYFVPTVDASMAYFDDFFSPEHVPFAVMGSNTVVNVNGRQVRGRSYPWGVVDIEDESYSDFARLRALLIRNSMRDLYDNTNEVLYEKFRIAKYESFGFEGPDSESLVDMIERQRASNEAKLAKAKEEMEISFHKKVTEMDKSLREFELEYQQKVSKLNAALDATKSKCEQKMAELEQLREAMGSAKNKKK